MNTRTRTWRRISFVLGALLLSLSSANWADEGQPGSGDKPVEKPAKEPAEEVKPKSLLEKLGDELSKDIDETPDGKSNEDVDKMERAVKGMRSAGDKLDEGLTTDETQKIQKQVIKDLEDIINQLENPPPNQGGGGGGGGGGGASGRNRRGGGSQFRLRRPQGAGAKGASAGRQQNLANADEKSGEQNSEKATDSSKKMHEERKAAEEAARRKKLEMDIWGHLPAHLREELLSTYGERMLPKYEELVKQFYEVLSTQGDPKAK